MAKRGNGEGCITRRADGRWAAVLSVPGPGGTRTRKFIYGETRADVAVKLARSLKDLQDGIRPANERLATKQFLTEWLESTVRPNKRESTYRGYEVNIRVHLSPAIGNVPLARLTPADLRKMMAAQTAAGLSPRTIQYVRATLRTALQQAVADGIVSRNVAELAPGPSVQRKEIHPLDSEQVRAFLAGIAGERLEALYVVALSLGLRQSEILGLRWEDVDLDAGTLRVAQTLGRGPGISFSAPKSAKSRRILHMPELTAAALRQHRIRQLEERLAARPEWQDHGLVFTTHFGTPIDHRNVGRYFKAQLARLGLPPQRFHDTRHACATFLLSQAVPLRVVQEILGHSQISLTADTYAHVMPALQREAMAHVDRAFASV